jgi:hypothetical protein
MCEGSCLHCMVIGPGWPREPESLDGWRYLPPEDREKISEAFSRPWTEVEKERGARRIG